ncbi:MAG TPA: hypothetical protein VE398_26755 [Acidobacteriota bacterium]|nr:hypothetical protein [Acidobacteriota bacterium]
MRINIVVVAVAVLTAGHTSVRAQTKDASLPSAPEILDKYVEATGGKAAYDRIHTIYSRGTFSVLGTGIHGNLSSYEAEPGKSLSILDIPGGERIQEGTNGNVAWVVSTQDGARLKEGEERATALREATFNSKVYWRKLYPVTECAGIEAVNGDACFKVVLKPAAGKPITQYYDTKSFLLTKSVILLNTPTGEVPSENFYTDYRQVNRILFPHSLNHRVGREEIVVVIDAIECNADVPWYRFDLPEEVRALLRKISDRR